MMRIATATNIVQAKIWCDLLCEAGLPALVLRADLGTVRGLIPFGECDPEVWIEHEEHEARARQLLNDLTQMTQHRWTCVCGELVEGGFEQCWSCGKFMAQSESQA